MSCDMCPNISLSEILVKAARKKPPVGVAKEVEGMYMIILGIAIGIVLHRALMAFVLRSSPDSLCSYCKWIKQKRNRH